VLGHDYRSYAFINLTSDKYVSFYLSYLPTGRQAFAGAHTKAAKR